MILFFFIAIASFGMLRHDGFCDELQAWLITRDSDTPWRLLDNLRFEGHPALWYLLLWPVSQITWSPDAMKPLSLLASAAAMAVFLWHAPCSRAEKILFPFGAYFLFEYTIKSRSYCLGALLLMLYCASWPNRDRKQITLAIVIGLMANVHVYFGIIALAGGAAIVMDRLVRHGLRGLFVNARQDGMAIAIVACLFILAAVTAAPPITGDQSIARPANILPPALLLSDQVIGTTWLISLDVFHAHVPYVVITGLLIQFSVMASIIYAARRRSNILLFYGLSVIGIVFLFYSGYPAQAQHGGTLFLPLVAAVWMLRTSTLPTSTGRRPAGRVLPIALFCQAVFGVAVVSTHIFIPYSNGRNVATFVREQGWAADPVAGLGPLLTTVCGYLQKPWCFYAERSQQNSYLRQDAAPLFVDQVGWSIENDAAALDRFAARASSIGTHVTLLVPLGWPNDPDILARHGFVLKRAFLNASKENYLVYRKQ